MRPRYLLVATEGLAPLPPRLERAAGCASLERRFKNDRLAVFANASCNVLAVGDRGCIVGTLFHRHGPAEAVRQLGDADVQAIVQGGGRTLLGRFWGGYVAALDEPAGLKVMRDPSAALPCYMGRAGDHIGFASDAELLVETGFADGEVDWDGLAAHLLGSGLPTPGTALRGIRELLPAFVWRHFEDQRPCWSPWDHAADLHRGDGSAGERLARTIKHCVHAWASTQGRLLASVSGGLDSSIVAAALAQSGADASCLTMYGEDSSGDERPYARTLCRHLGLPLLERPYELDRIDISEALGTHLPRPTDRTHALSYERAHVEVAREIAASAFITGNGGDSVFGYSHSAAAAADRYLAEGLGGGFVTTLRDVSRQTGCGLVRAAAAALRIARGSRAYRWRPDGLFLSRDIVESLGQLPGHPWLDAPAGALPGKAAHIASLLRMQQCLEPSRSRELPVLNPLLSQPVVELCLAVPSWQWRTGGRDRALARRAFANDLPPAILQRRVKGGPDGFAALVLDRFRAQIRERLLDGHLARRGIIDRDKVERELAAELSSAGEERARILEFVAAEAWIDSWLTRAGPVGSAPCG